MIKEIVKDKEFLSQKCVNAEKSDSQIIKDLIDTATHHIENCCGLASNQIGYNKRIIVYYNGRTFVPLVNPMIIFKSKETYNSTEGCLSLNNTSTVRRHKNIKVSYELSNGRRVMKSFSGLLSTIIQHEIDHLNGILI